MWAKCHFASLNLGQDYVMNLAIQDEFGTARGVARDEIGELFRKSITRLSLRFFSIEL